MYPYQSLQPYVDAIIRWHETRDRLTEEQDDAREAMHAAENDLQLINLDRDVDVAAARVTLATYRASMTAYTAAIFAVLDYDKAERPEVIRVYDGASVIYYTNDADEICPDCAYSVADELAGADPYYEGPTVECAECHTVIESAYGDPDDRRVQRAIDRRYSPYETYWRAAQERAQADAARRRALTS